MGRIDSLLLNTAPQPLPHSFPLFFPPPLSPLSFSPSPLSFHSLLPLPPHPLCSYLNRISGGTGWGGGLTRSRLISRYRDGPSPPPHPSTLPILSTRLPVPIIISSSYILDLLPAAYKICFPSMIVSGRFKRDREQYRLILQG